ncbi:MAG: CDP-diacylglycerol--glycerol-3-phosphate 3-phosphatidyltransferase [Candidatus Omnitrophota bacterium]
MNLPNKLTVSRIFLSFLFLFFLFSRGVIFKVLALATFLLASGTDLLDGYLAKKNNMLTDFGKLMDPVADKVLTLSAILGFVEMGLIPAWTAVIIVFRELLITGLRLLALSKKRVLAAEIGGKHKMVSQVAAIVCVLSFLVVKEAGVKVFKYWNPHAEILYRNTIFAMMLITVVLTIISGTSYLIRNRDLYRTDRPRKK